MFTYKEVKQFWIWSLNTRRLADDSNSTRADEPRRLQSSAIMMNCILSDVVR